MVKLTSFWRKFILLNVAFPTVMATLFWIVDMLVRVQFWIAELCVVAIQIGNVLLFRQNKELRRAMVGQSAEYGESLFVAPNLRHSDPLLLKCCSNSFTFK